MSAAQKLLQDRKEAQSKLDFLFKQPSLTLVIHYSNEGFSVLKLGRSPRIVSIAVRNLDGTDAASFSIHLEAEKKSISLNSIEENYEVLESSLLDSFYSYVSEHKSHRWVHWNMRDKDFGFEALEHRCSVLKKCKSLPIPQSQRYDLSRILYEIYGPDYVGKGKMKKLMKLNQITDLNFLSGEQEESAFKDKGYAKVHSSTLRKVEVIAYIAELAQTRRLRTSKKLWKPYIRDPRVWPDLVMEHWSAKWAALIVLAVAVLGIILDFIGLINLF